LRVQVPATNRRHLPAAHRARTEAADLLPTRPHTPKLGRRGRSRALHHGHHLRRLASQPPRRLRSGGATHLAPPTSTRRLRRPHSHQRQQALPLQEHPRRLRAAAPHWPPLRYKDRGSASTSPAMASATWSASPRRQAASSSCNAASRTVASVAQHRTRQGRLSRTTRFKCYWHGRGWNRGPRAIKNAAPRSSGMSYAFQASRKSTAPD
jgi:hypothetical protein